MSQSLYNFFFFFSFDLNHTSLFSWVVHTQLLSSIISPFHSLDFCTFKSLYKIFFFFFSCFLLAAHHTQLSNTLTCLSLFFRLCSHSLRLHSLHHSAQSNSNRWFVMGFNIWVCDGYWIFWYLDLIKVLICGLNPWVFWV